MSPRFARYVGVDYSGAETPSSSLKGLRIYESTGDQEPAEVPPPPSPRKYWTRRGVAEWLADRLAEPAPTIVGIDHAFSFPFRYFEKNRLPPDWPAFLDDFHRHWPTDEEHTYVDFVRNGAVGSAGARVTSSLWRRQADVRTGAKSVFHFDVPGSVAKFTHSGLPWLRYLRNNLGDRVHWWPFEGWDIPEGKSVVAEVYPRLWAAQFPRDGRTSDQHDAWVVAEWLRRADVHGTLAEYLHPHLGQQDEAEALVEGWILGVR